MTVEKIDLDADSALCPRCARNRVDVLRSMSKYSSLVWVKCDGCEHIFTLPPPHPDTGDQTPLRLVKF
jgi:hypothetical protein